ncbi:ABC transporter substrate binding protein [Desulfonatronum sp. SC1]|uniref:hybrid sensor histidine kinase/response regulator n=1 Tax=Desulfonatronum sp. SC1 TaxID=2109626 RepID=UPI000D31A3FF|nr:ABC transporter substrate binding protein [Desulfonatronum sp. SC1]PTN37810.1 hybrid sensor histidine kinase/response regulator [Desulfonatronum sp. SC1]
MILHGYPLPRILAALALCGLLLAAATAPVFSQPEPGREKKRVFYLNSYHNGYAWSDHLQEGIRRGLEQSRYHIELQIEYMDAKKYPYEVIADTLFRLYQDKFVDEHFDIVIVSDNDAYNFILEHRDRLFPDIPVVFCGLNDVTPGEVDQSFVTGILENIGVRDTLELALSIHPNKNKLVVIGDESITGVAIRKQIEAVQPYFEDRLEFEFWERYSLREIQERVGELPRNAFLFFIPFFHNVGGQFMSASEVLEAVAMVTDLPIYSNWEFLLGHGMVGGRLLSGRRHGMITAEMALRIMEGEAPSTIPVISEVVDQYMFDYQVLMQRDISRRQLPAGSLFINEPEAFYELDKQVFQVIMVSLFTLVVVLGFLVRNIIQRRAVERRIRHQLSFLEILMDAIPQLVCWKDRKQRYLGANRAFAEFFGIESPRKLLHQTDAAMLPNSEFVDWVARMDRQVVEEDRPLRKIKAAVQDAQGENAWLEINKVPLHNEKGEVVGTLSTAENITHEMNLERQLLQSQKMEAIGTLAGGIAHDFNNILTSIINSTELALGDIDPESPTAEDLERVLRVSSRGRNLVERILTFSRPSQEGFRPTDLPALVRESVALLQRSLPRNIVIQDSISGRSDPVMLDPTQVTQVLMNLCTNAFQAMQTTGGELTIRLEEIRVTDSDAEELNITPGAFFRLTVSDTGPGIAPETLDKIFDPFFTTKGKTEGTGLGLAMVLGIVKNHKGAVHVSSTRDQGAAFSILLPMIAADRSVLTAHPAPIQKGSGVILFVEDEEEQLATTPRSLEQLGYTVLSAAAGNEALQILEQRPDIDLVLTDYDMPGLTGIDLARQIWLMRPDLPVILVSGRSYVLEMGEAADNIRLVLPKPFNKADLSAALSKVMAKGPATDHASGQISDPYFGQEPEQ